MSDYWTNFARTGDPNGQGLPRWPAFETANSTVLSLGDPIIAGALTNRDSLEALDAVYTVVRGKALTVP